MYRRGLVLTLVVLLRRYAVALFLIGALAVAIVQVYTVGVGPRPQGPPEGYLVERDKATLSWDKGTREAPITLQISIDDDSFDEPDVERTVTGTTHHLNEVEGGATYYWRLVQDGDPSPVASFSVSKHHVDI